jgi:hypothetical protein
LCYGLPDLLCRIISKITAIEEQITKLTPEKNKRALCSPVTMNQPVQGKNSLGKQRGVIEEETSWFLLSTFTEKSA